MIIVIASANKGKIKEFQALLKDYEIKSFNELIDDIDIIEDGLTFQENAIIKAKTIQVKLAKKYPNEKDKFIIISDDSGISVKELNNEPNIYSARYAGINANDEQNKQKLINNLNKLNIKKSKAFYTACIAIAYKEEIYTTHGWMHGDVINKCIGNNGFGYDALFIPKGHDKTLAEMDFENKKELSHRTKALNLAMKIIKTLKK